jgi:valyl-tRNA synthetase
LAESRVKGYKSFTNKLWNASKFLQLNECKIDKNFDISKIITPINQWLINELAITKINIDIYMEKYLFHEVANEIYRFVWHVYCDWYVEFAKSLFNDNSTNSKETKSTAMWALREILKLSHPVMPFITEKLWSTLFDNKNFLMNEHFTKLKIQDNYKKSQDNFKNLIQIITLIRNLRSELNIPYKNTIIVNINNKNDDFVAFINDYKNEITRLLKLESLLLNDKAIKNEGSANLICFESTIIVPLEGLVDTKNEIKKLNNRKDKELFELKKLNNKLKNSDFINKAPKHVVLSFKNQYEEIKSSIEKIDQIINTID